MKVDNKLQNPLCNNTTQINCLKQKVVPILVSVRIYLNNINGRQLTAADRDHCMGLSYIAVKLVHNYAAGATSVTRCVSVPKHSNSLAVLYL